MKKLFILITLALLTTTCKNRDINEGEAFRPRAVRDDFDNSHFSKVTVDGIEYLMMERDNNNPHEGFGFMAFRANRLMEKQDTIISYLRTMQHFQSKMYARMFNLSEEEAAAQYGSKFDEFLNSQDNELRKLKQEKLTNSPDE